MASRRNDDGGPQIGLHRPVIHVAANPFALDAVGHAAVAIDLYARLGNGTIRRMTWQER